MPSIVIHAEYGVEFHNSEHSYTESSYHECHYADCLNADVAHARFFLLKLPNCGLLLF